MESLISTAVTSYRDMVYHNHHELLGKLMKKRIIEISIKALQTKKTKETSKLLHDRLRLISLGKYRQMLRQNNHHSLKNLVFNKLVSISVQKYLDLHNHGKLKTVVDKKFLNFTLKVFKNLTMQNHHKLLKHMLDKRLQSISITHYH